jgi:hypothetical protein
VRLLTPGAAEFSSTAVQVQVQAVTKNTADTRQQLQQQIMQQAEGT